MKIFRTTTEQVAELRELLEKERSKNRVLELEREKLIEVIERDRMRVQAETAAYAASIVDSERNDDTERRNTLRAAEY